MNILQINSGSGWSGGQYQVLLLSRGLRERGHQVVVACTPESALARRLGIERQVILTGFREDVERFYRVMSVSVNCATAGEGLPGVLRESLAMEVPVVATDVGGSREVVTDGETGFLIPPHDPKALARAILRLLRDPELRRTMGRNGRKWVEERFSIEAMVAQTEALYQEALSANRI